MSTELRCEKRVKVKRQTKSCNELAMVYEVGGKSFSARAVLCVKHKVIAEKEGFTLKAVPQNA